MAIQFKRIIKMERSVRLEAQGLTDKEIASHLSMTPAGLAQMKTDPDYEKVRVRIRTGVISELDADLAANIKNHREKLNQMVPPALDTLFELAILSKDEKIRLAATKTILNREGHLAEVSRIGLPTEDQGGIGIIVDEEISNALVKALAQKQNAISENLNDSKAVSSTVQ